MGGNLFGCYTSNPAYQIFTLRLIQQNCSFEVLMELLYGWVTTTRGTVLKGHGIRKVENHCSRPPGMPWRSRSHDGRPINTPLSQNLYCRAPFPTGEPVVASSFATLLSCQYCGGVTSLRGMRCHHHCCMFEPSCYRTRWSVSSHPLPVSQRAIQGFYSLIHRKVKECLALTD